MTIVEFLSARVDEQEADGRRLDYLQTGEFLIADAVAKRTIIAQVQQVSQDLGEASSDPRRQVNIPILVNVALALEITLKHLASVYGDHPDYDDKWKP